MSDPSNFSSAWLALAQRTAWKVNVGWWLDKLAPLAVGTGFIVAGGLLGLRLNGHSQPSPAMLATAFAGAGLLLGLSAHALARRHYISPKQGLIRLEAQHHLNNALTVAAAGRAAWPAIPHPSDDGWHWDLRRLIAPWLLATASVLLATWLPLPSTATSPLAATAEPRAWQQMEEWLDELTEKKIIPTQEQEAQKARIQELRDQPPDQWFNHDSLHAGDSLKEQLQRDLSRMAQDLDTASRNLNGLKNHSDSLSATQKDRLLKDLDEALHSLQNNALELHPDLLKELSQIAPGNLPALSQEQAEQLRRSLQDKAKEARKNSLAPGPGFVGDGSEQETEDETPERGFGQGGTDRGPGSAPLTLADDENDFGTDKREDLASRDYSRAQLGTLLGLQDGKHEPDKNEQSPMSAGDAVHQGGGGDQVWKDTLTPEEKAVLKRVFQ